MKNLFPLLLLSFLFTACQNKCHDDDCQNGGACRDGICWCPTGYTDEYCHKETRGNMIGSYTGFLTDTETGKRKNITVVITNHKEDITAIDIKIDELANVYECRAMNTSNFIANSAIEGNIWGSVKDDVLSFTLTHQPPFQPTTNYEFAGSRQ